MARSVRSRMFKRKNVVADVDITSLLDIITILLVFLIMSYNPAGIEFNIDKGLELPRSKSKDFVKNTIVVQVSKEAIWVDDKKILEITDFKNIKADLDGKRIVSLYNELLNKKELSNQVTSMAPPGAKKNENENLNKTMINLIIDKSIRYTFIKKILYTCANAGFLKYKLLVQGQE